MCYCRTESPRPAMWTPTVRSTASAVSRVTVVPKVKSAPWHQVHLAHIWKVQWNLSNLMLCIVACFFMHCSMFFYLSKLFGPWTCPYHFCLIILFWTSGSSLVCNPLGTLIHSLLPVSVNYLPYLAVFDEDPRTDLMQIIHLAIIASLFSLCINNSKTLNSNHEICSGAL